MELSPEQQDRLREIRATLASAWWKGYCDRLEEREQKYMEQLLTGTDARFEDRQRGAIAALRWARSFLAKEAQRLDSLTRQE